MNLVSLAVPDSSQTLQQRPAEGVLVSQARVEANPSAGIASSAWFLQSGIGLKRRRNRTHMIRAGRTGTQVFHYKVVQKEKV